MNKPIKPNITIPENFAQNGVKTDFDDTLLADGFDNLRPDVLAGDNLNKFIDDTYQGLNYGMAAADAINLINEGETLTVVDGKLTSGASGGGLEIGDIGPAPLGIDETKGKRRYLNGQVIMQDQYVEFTNKVKTAQTLYPNLFVTEEQWQATVTMSAFGACYKFVVDDGAGTIRLPKITGFIQGLTDLSSLGDLVEAGLPNITGSYYSINTGGANLKSGALYGVETGDRGPSGNGTNFYRYLYFDASRSNPTYGNSPTVQPESGRYPYFIQVATGAETEDNIINEIELNNPYTLFDSKYVEAPLYNVSWLLANGSYNGSNAVHPSAYQALLVENNTEIEVGSTVTLPIGTEYTKRGQGVKLSTETFTDYDFVLNTAEETFRLPVKVKLASGSAIVGNGMALGLTDGTNNYGMYTSTYNANHLTAVTNALGKDVGTTTGTGTTIADTVITGITTDANNSGIETSDNDLYLYFYVGETVQNANLINAGRIEEKIANLIPDNSSLISGYAMPSNRYIDLTLGTSGTEYTAPANGYFNLHASKQATGRMETALIRVKDNFQVMSGMGSTNDYRGLAVLLPCLKGDVIKVRYDGTVSCTFRFYYAGGEE